MVINLTNGLTTEIDDIDYPKITGITWRAQKGHKNNWYAVGAVKGESIASGNQKIVKMHRLIAGATDPKYDVDHRDHNTLNNKKANLRICTKSQNQANRSGVASHKKHTKYVGVFARPWKNSNKVSFRAGIRINKKWITLGTFSNEKSAAIAYNDAAKKHFGEFASLNEIR